MSDWRLTTDNAAVVVIDPQEKLMAAMPRRAEVTSAIEKLVRAADILHLPALLTLQYVKGLGPVCAELSDVCAKLPAFEKLHFSCCGSDQFVSALKATGRQRILLCGIEAHVCVQQTAIDLLNRGLFVYVCADAVTSRRELDYLIAIERMRDCGAVITTVESAVFELLRQAGTDTFKACLPLFK
ncbi:MAG: isochorismatase family protein [Verrucomicrobiae bacterium]|nr:isochorismatase family protein [Verrucomicrobiae bacterium]MDW8343879.1 isochorismatase family protein [Verrucomicrobiae bacterium]